MTQGVLPFKYEEEKRERGMTSLGGSAGVFGFSDGHRIGRKHRASFADQAAGLDGPSDADVVVDVEFGGRRLCGRYAEVGE